MIAPETVKQATDVAAGVTALGTVVQVLPSIAGGFTVLWMAIRIGEWVFLKWNTETVRKWTKRNLD